MTIYMSTKINIVLILFYAFAITAGDIEENSAEIEQGLSYDLLGNNLEGKSTITIVKL